MGQRSRKTAGMLLILLLFSFPAWAEQFDEHLSFTGEHDRERVVLIPQRGWYSIQAESATGTSVSLTDRMIGVLGSDGTTGRRDGRLDLLLEEGEYLLKVMPDLRVANATVHVTAFDEQGEYPYLIDGETIHTDLFDLQTRSFWITSSGEETIVIEMMGRNLKSANLWLDGQWLENATPVSAADHSPVSGRPMQYLEYALQLPAGSYLLQCVGGEPAPWPEEDGTHPFFIRRGVAYKGQDNIVRHTISPFGRDSFLVSSESDYFQVRRPTVAETGLAVAEYRPGRSRYSGRISRSAITEDSLDPWCSVSNSFGGEFAWVTLSGAPGDQLELMFFSRSDGHALDTREGAAQYWISSLQSSGADDSIDMTSLILRQVPGEDRAMVLAGDALPLGGGTLIARRLNFFEQTVVFVDIKKPGTYRVIEEPDSNGTGLYRFLSLNALSSFDRVEYQRAGALFELSAGYHFLDMVPEKEGILSVSIFTEGRQAKDKNSEVRGAVLWPEVRVTQSDAQTMLSDNLSFKIPTAFVVRELPVDIADPLAFLLRQGESALIQAVCDEPSQLLIDSPFGGEYSVRVDGATTVSGARLSEDTHTILVTNIGPERGYFSVVALPLAPASPTDPPVIEPADERFRVVTPGNPLFIDYKRGSSHRFLLRVPEPSLYRIETTGRLAMGLRVRATLLPSLYTANQNAAGRNALVQSYLKQGDYLVEVAPSGASEGRAGLFLNTTSIQHGGTLVSESVARRTVRRDDALAYEFAVVERPKVTLRTIGLDRSFTYRLENEDGWPIAIERSGMYTGELEPGSYRYISLPTTSTSRRVTVFELDPVELDEPETSPDGPVEMGLNEIRTATWRERESRTPDRYRFSVPAQMDVSISLSDGMIGRISLTEGDLIGEFVEKELYALAAGDYEIAVESEEINNDAQYRLSVATEVLAHGLVQGVDRYPVGIPVSIDEAGIYDIWSLGTSDVRARLFNESGALAENDDREDDWNFSIRRHLLPGTYTLEVDSFDQRGGATIAMDRLSESEYAGVRIPFDLVGSLSDGVARIPVVAGSADGVTVITSSGPTRIGLYRGETLIADGTDRLHIPLLPDANYSLRVYNDVGGEVPFSLSGLVLTGATVVLDEATMTFPVGQAAKILSSRSLSFQLKEDDGGLLYSPGIEIPCSPLTGEIIANEDEYGWLVDPTEPTDALVTAVPFELEAGRTEMLRLSTGGQSFRLSHYGNEILLLHAEAQDTPLGIMLTPPDDYRPDQFWWRGMSGPGLSTWLGFPAKGEYQGRVWRVDRVDPGQSAPATAAPRVLLSADTYRLRDKRYISSRADETVMIQPGDAVAFVLEDRPQNVTAILEKGAVATVWSDGRAVATFDTSAGPREDAVGVTGGTVALINTAKTPTLARVRTQLSTDTDDSPITAVVTAARPYEATVSRGSALIFDIIAGQGEEGIIVVAGAAARTTLRGDNGALYAGTTIPGPIPMTAIPLVAGSLQVDVDTGYLRVFLTTESGRLTDFVAMDRIKGETALDGTAALRNTAQFWTVAAESAGILRITSRSAGVTALLDDGEVVSAAVSTTAVSTTAAGRTLTRYVEPGVYTVYTRPVGDEYQEGEIISELIQPVPYDSIADAGPRIIAPGETTVFSFDVTTESMVGIGIEAGSEILNTSVYDSNFGLVGTGRLLFRKLSPGEYFLEVRSGNTPVRYRPVIYGADGSRSEIPRDVIEHYEGDRQ
jgi:hypothetical protein